jgi:hypothetical protein
MVPRSHRCAGSWSYDACQSIETSTSGRATGTGLTASPNRSAKMRAAGCGKVESSRAPFRRKGTAAKCGVATATVRRSPSGARASSTTPCASPRSETSTCGTAT